jgi:hypothetical protein
VEAQYLLDVCWTFCNRLRIQQALSEVIPEAFVATRMVLPPLRISALACAGAPPRM